MAAAREDEDDFLEFWAQHRAQQDRPTKRILGVDVEVPNELPLNFSDRFAHLQDSEDPEDIQALLAILFGEGVLGRWIDNGVTYEQLKVLLAWGVANGSGKAMTFAEAAVVVEQAEAAAAAGKAATPINRAARRASSKTAGSAAGGRSSKRTSRANTG